MTGVIERQEVDHHCQVALDLTLRWQSAHARHQDRLHLARFNVWRDLDLLPPVLQEEVLGRRLGHRASHRFAPGALLPEWCEQQLLRASIAAFDTRFLPCRWLEPRLGRFYPKGILAGIDGSFRQDATPIRLVARTADDLVFDANHPLARCDVEVRTAVRGMRAAPNEHGGRCQEAIAELATGPGMQVPYGELTTNFFADDPFVRRDPRPDGGYYRIPRWVNHLDAAALEQVGRLYERLLPPGARILDLMASWDSHVPVAVLRPAAVTGLGLSRDELDANPILAERVVHDLNDQPALPFADGSFDAVVCTVSVEYLTHPIEVFAQVARVLRPGGIFVVVFSNRWFPPKVVRIWEDLHEFERPGLVLAYFRHGSRFRELETFSLRGLPRPSDDPHTGQSPLSDPVHAVWGRRAG
ncbi:MAG: class I SAM-dependent methyltransferase [Nitrospirota bacterium]